MISKILSRILSGLTAVLAYVSVVQAQQPDRKSTAKDNLPAYEGAEVTAKATWAIPYLAVTATTDNEQSVNMTFANEIKSGEIHIKVRCVDGSILSSGVNAVTTGAVGPYNGGTASAPFYFYNPGKRNDQSIKIELL